MLLWAWLRRKETWARALLVGLGFYIIAMLPALGLLKMSYMRLTLVADHFQYISIGAIIALVVAAGSTRAMRPLWLLLAALCSGIASYFYWDQVESNLSLGMWLHIGQVVWIGGLLALAVAALLGDREIWKYVWRGFLFAVLTCATFITYGQSEIYHGEKSLWSATLDKNPTTWQGHNHLGAALYMEGNWQAAGPHFLAATQLKSENPESHNNLGLYYSMMAQAQHDPAMSLRYMQQAIREYQTAVGIKDDSAMETNLANAYEQVHDFPNAISTYQHALTLNPDNASAHCNLGYALMQQGRVDEAIPEFMNTIIMDPRMPQGPADLRQALRIKGIDPAAPPPPGTYKFDVQKAIDLLRSEPQPPPGQ